MIHREKENFHLVVFVRRQTTLRIIIGRSQRGLQFNVDTGRSIGTLRGIARKKQNQSCTSSQQVNFVDDHQVEKSEDEVFIASHTSHVDRCNWHVHSACTRYMVIDEICLLHWTDLIEVK